MQLSLSFGLRNSPECPSQARPLLRPQTSRRCVWRCCCPPSLSGHPTGDLNYSRRKLTTSNIRSRDPFRWSNIQPCTPRRYREIFFSLDRDIERLVTALPIGQTAVHALLPFTLHIPNSWGLSVGSSWSPICARLFAYYACANVTKVVLIIKILQA